MFSLKLKKRTNPSPWLQFKISFISISIAGGLGSIILLLLGYNPFYAFLQMFLVALGSIRGFQRVLIKSIPLLLIGVGLSIAFKAKVWNIGAPGQMAIGGIAGSGVALFLFPNLPSLLLLPMMFLAGFAAGAALAALCAILKVKIQLNMVISTLMLNYVMYKFLDYLLYGPWQAPQLGFPYTKEIPNTAKLPVIGDIPYPTLLLAIVLTFLVYLILKQTTIGYEIRAFGESREAARYAGIDKLKITTLVMILSGGFAGLAGVGEVAGVHHVLKQGITGSGSIYAASYGYTAIFISWLGRNNPIGVLISTFFVAVILIGGQGLQLIGVPYAVVIAILGLMLLTLTGGAILLNYRIIVTNSREDDKT